MLVALLGLAVEGAYKDPPNLEVIKPHGALAEGAPRDPSIAGNALTDVQLGKLHRLVDSSGDGLASMAEFERFAAVARGLAAKKDAAKWFEDLDINKDGELDSQEFRKEIDNWAAVDDPGTDQEPGLKLELLKFQAADANRDGRLSKEELPGLFYPDTNPAVIKVVVEDSVARRDRDGDGKLDPSEFFADGSEEGVDLGITEQEQEDFDQLDLDGSGKLDAEEVGMWESGRFHQQNALKAMFEIADKDADEHLSHEEMQESRLKLAGSEVQFHLLEWVEHHGEL